MIGPGHPTMLTELDHPLVHAWLSELRDVETGPARFRALLGVLGAALFLEAARDLELAPRRVRTPLAEVAGQMLKWEALLVPILRAGLGMVEGIWPLVPGARVAHVGIYRHHATLEAVPYYTPAVQDVVGHPAFVLDPMLATGGSAVAALDLVKEWGAAPRLLAVIGAPEGVRRVQADHPDVPIYLGALDECLNERGYIVPGLGDAGDRQFGG
jgi:uracil phosphoribosyltransferase